MCLERKLHAFYEIQGFITVLTESATKPKSELIESNPNCHENDNRKTDFW
jgi:hypothetical protein